jgi:DNA-binding MarR family transcriptional regulator
MTDVQPQAGLPELPDVADLIIAAETRLAHFARVRDEAQAEVDRAQAYLERLTGKSPASSSGHAVSEEAMAAVLASIGSHNGCSITTIAQDAGKGQSTVSRAIRVAEREGWVRTERRQRGRLRAWLTEAGMEKVTSS